MGRGDAYTEEARRKVADHLAMHGTYLNVGEKADAPALARPSLSSKVEGLPPDRAYGLGQVLRYCLRAGEKDDMDVEPGKADSYAHRSVSGHWRSR